MSRSSTLRLYNREPLLSMLWQRDIGLPRGAGKIHGTKKEKAWICTEIAKPIEAWAIFNKNAGKRPAKELVRLSFDHSAVGLALVVCACAAL